MSWVIGSNGFCAFQIVVYFLSIQDVENGFSSRMHEVLINIIHTIVDKHITNSLCPKIVKLFFLFNQIFIDLVMIFCLLVFMLEEKRKYYCS